MSNLFFKAPTLAPNFPVIPAIWTCPITRLQVPKNPDSNVQWRAEMLAAAENDTEFQQDLYTACSQSILLFVNAFCWTLRVFETTEGVTKQAKHEDIPYVTWEIQDRHIVRIKEAVEQGFDLLTDKTRDMGATWDHLVVFLWFFLFRDKFSGLVISNKEDNVDQLGGPGGADPSTLFGKIDYAIAFLPEWMRPAMDRKKMHLVNASNGNRIDGESANKNAGTSGRRTAILLDEMSKMEYGNDIKRSTRDVSRCRLPNSTPNGAGTAYSKWRTSGTVEVFELPWWEHPEKGFGRSVVKDDLGRYTITSPWYVGEKADRTPKELAIEVDMDHIGSGDLFFEGNILEEHKQMFAREPLRTLDITWRKEAADKDVVKALRQRKRQLIKKTPGKKLRLWTTLIENRLDQTKSYTLAADISKGQGASNSVISVGCNETGEKVAEWADANTPPYELARVACALALWVGGRNKLPTLIYENNGDPGMDFNRQIVRVYKYPRLWTDRVMGTPKEKKAKRKGWRSNQDKKAAGLGMLRKAYAHGTFINHSSESIAEAQTYVYYENGGVGPATLIAESTSARATHGDRVIADMLLVIAREDTPAAQVRSEKQYGMKTFHGRVQSMDRAKKDERGKRTFDFTR